MERGRFFCRISGFSQYKKTRLLAIISGLIFILIIFMIPSGIKRLGGVVAVEGDQSISHRLVVWQGALMMAIDHLWQGVGEGKFGQEFSHWYQPGEMPASYRTVVNDYLTFVTERGWLTFFLLIFVLGSLFVISHDLIKK